MIKTISIAFLITVVMILYMAFLFTPGYGATSDDITMMRISSGMFSGTPSEYLVYTNVIIGKILKNLYTWNRSVDWYSIYIYLIHFISIWFLLVIFLRTKNNRSKLYALMFFLLILASYELRFLLRVQFTTVSAMAGIAGLFLFITESRNEKNSVFLNVVGIFLVIVSYLCRKEGLLLVLIPFFPMLLLELYRNRSRLLMASLAISFVCCVSANIYDNYCYESVPEWKEYKEYNSHRLHFHGYEQFYNLQRHLVELEEEKLPAMGWSVNDLRMFHTWYYTNKEKFSKESYQQLLEVVKSIQPDQSLWLKILKAEFKLIWRYVYFTIFVTLAIMMFRVTSSKENLLILLTYGITIALILYLSYRGRIVERVSLPILCICLLVTFYLTLECFEDFVKNFKEKYMGYKYYLSINSKFFKKDEDVDSLIDPSTKQKGRLSFHFPVRLILVLVFLYCSGVSFYLHVLEMGEFSNVNLERHVKFENLVNGYQKLFDKHGEDTTLISWGGYIVFRWQKPFKVYEKFYDNKVIEVIWTLHSPLYQESLERSKIRNLDTAILERDDIFVCCYESYADFYIEYMKENYNLDVEGELLLEDYFSHFKTNEIGHNNIYKFRSVKEE